MTSFFLLLFCAISWLLSIPVISTAGERNDERLGFIGIFLGALSLFLMYLFAHG